MDTALRVHGVMGVSLVWCEDAKGNPSYHLGETSPFHDNSTGYRFMCMAPAGALDGTERRRQRPTEAAKQTAHDSGKKKAHTDKNVLLINAYTSKVVYLRPTVAGKTHDKKAVDEAHLTSPVNSTLDKDTGFQGYEPAGILTQQPQKSPEARS